jgi:hypothetical protein
MHTYYFAHCCLRILNKNNILGNSQLSYFKNEAPYCSTVDLNIAHASWPADKNVISVPVGSGVSVGGSKEAGWLFSRDDSGNRCCLAAAPDYSDLQGYLETADCGDEAVLREGFMHLLRIAVECHLACNGGVSLHASCLDYNAKALLFTAPSGTGKSTQARIWEKHYGARIISGDRPFLHHFEDGVRAYGVPWDGKEQIFLQADRPVLAIVELRRAGKNSLRRLTREQAFRLLLKQCFIPIWDDELKFAIIKTIRLITQKIPFYRLFCTPDHHAAQLLHEVLFGNRNTFLKKEQAEMKLKEGFILRNVVGEWVVMPTGSNVMDFEGAIVLNDVSAFIWEQMGDTISRDDLLQLLLDEYEIDRQTAAADLDEFLEKLKSRGILQEYQ